MYVDSYKSRICEHATHNNDAAFLFMAYKNSLPRRKRRKRVKEKFRAEIDLAYQKMEFKGEEGKSAVMLKERDQLRLLEDAQNKF